MQKMFKDVEKYVNPDFLPKFNQWTPFSASQSDIEGYY